MCVGFFVFSQRMELIQSEVSQVKSWMCTSDRTRTKVWNTIWKGQKTFAWKSFFPVCWAFCGFSLFWKEMKRKPGRIPMNLFISSLRRSYIQRSQSRKEPYPAKSVSIDPPSLGTTTTSTTISFYVSYYEHKSPAIRESHPICFWNKIVKLTENIFSE